MSRPIRWAGLLLALVAAGSAGWWWFGGWRDERTWRWSTDWPNTRPGVSFVGDAACESCHGAIADSYGKHPMGRSMAAIGDLPAELRGGDLDDGQARILFEQAGYRYEMVRRGGRVFHRESRVADDGRVLGSVEAEVTEALGSGEMATAFLLERDGYLFQSPATWYSQQHRWGLAPGYERREGRFDRQITPGCLFCHVDRVRHVEGTEGRYQTPIFQGHASIGCERCHGPGALHVADPDADSLIVNPARLGPSLREAVCQQCHLVGASAIVRYGRERDDFRPGLPLQEFLTIFVRGGDDASHPNADHVEQMARSRCFLASQGALGCISCHDPHRKPPAETRVAYYRDRCRTCHEPSTSDCALPIDRRMVDGEENCIACHMPRASTTDVQHVATTIHAIPRTAEPVSTPPASNPDSAPLVPFHRDLMTREERQATGRDLGVALRHRGRAASAIALPLLKTAVEAHPDDLLARESLGFALWGLKRTDEALTVFQDVLGRSPRRESALEAAALAAAERNQPALSIGFWDRAIAVDPWRSSFHAERASALLSLNRWDEALESADQALKRDPSNGLARRARITAELRRNQPDRALAEFQVLQELEPDNRPALERWYASLAATGPRPAPIPSDRSRGR